MSTIVQENTRIIPNRQTSLTKAQKEAVGLLSALSKKLCKIPKLGH